MPSRRETLKSAAAFAAAAIPVHLRAESQTGGAQPGGAQATGTDNTSVAADAVCLFDFEPVAKAKMSHSAWEYVNGAAADEITVRWNRESLNRIRLKPRVLVDVSKLDTSTSLLGNRMSFPILVAPTASQRATHPDGEMATVAAAGGAGATMVLSTLSNTSVEDVTRAAKSPIWFQLYVQQDRGFTRELVQRAIATGCKALCLTVDTPISGARNREQRAHLTMPPGVGYPHLEGLKTRQEVAKHLARRESGAVFSELLSANLTWKDLAWLLSFAGVPVVVKGVLNPDDADHAVKEGVSGIIVSNHGGRNLDTVPATIDALPGVAERVAGRVPVLMDGGIRRGTDVLKALALGAAAVLIGRPYVYGLGAAGEEGVARVLQILQEEFLMAMALTGRTTIAGIDRSVLWPA
jgi:4-hydroxymandelate oxidase